MSNSEQPLGEVIQYLRGITFKPEEKVEPTAEDAVVCMRTKNVQDILDESDLIAVPSSLVRRDELYLRAGDILLSSANSWNLVGKVCRVPQLRYRATAGGFISVVRPRSTVDSRYLYHWLASPDVQERIRGCARQTTNISNLSVPQFEQLRIRFPPLSEQRRIADILDKADAIRRKRKEAIALTEELLRSAFLDMFGDPVTNPKGWPVKPLGELLATDPRIGTLVPASDSPGTLVVRVGELGSYDVELSRSKRASLSDAEFGRFGLETGDVLLARAIGSEDHLGKASVLQPHDEPVAFDSHVMRLRFRDEILDPYVFVQWLKTPGGRARFMNEAGRTAVQFNVNGKQIVKVQIPLPPRAKQRRFRQLFNSARAMESRSDAALGESDVLFNSLVARAFSGALEAM